MAAFTAGEIALLGAKGSEGGNNPSILHYTAAGVYVEGLPLPANSLWEYRPNGGGPGIPATGYWPPNRQFQALNAVFDNLGKLLVTDNTNGEIGSVQRYKTDGSLDTTYGGSAAGNRTNNQVIWNQLGTDESAVKFNQPRRLDVFSDRRIAVGNVDRGAVHIISEAGALVSTLTVASRSGTVGLKGAVYPCISPDQKLLYYVDGIDPGILYAYDIASKTQKPNVSTVASGSWNTVRVTADSKLLIHQFGGAGTVGAYDGVALIKGLDGTTLASRKFSAYMNMDAYTVREVVPDPLDKDRVWIVYLTESGSIGGCHLKHINLYTGALIETFNPLDVNSATVQGMAVMSGVGANAAIAPVSTFLQNNVALTTSYALLMSLSLPRNANADLNWLAICTLATQNPSTSVRRKGEFQFRVSGGGVAGLLPTFKTDSLNSNGTDVETDSAAAWATAPKGSGTVALELWGKSTTAGLVVLGKATNGDEQTSLLAHTVA